MPAMTLKTLPTEAQLDEIDISLEGFVESFHKKLIEGMSAEVQIVDGGVNLDGYVIPYASWYSVT